MSVITKTKDKIVETLNRLFYAERDAYLVLLNDDYVFEGTVRQGLQNVLGHSASKAQELMLTAHNYGAAVVWTGSKKEAEDYALQLRTQYGLTMRIDVE